MSPRSYSDVIVFAVADLVLILVCCLAAGLGVALPLARSVVWEMPFSMLTMDDLARYRLAEKNDCGKKILWNVVQVSEP